MNMIKDGKGILFSNEVISACRKVLKMTVYDIYKALNSNLLIINFETVELDKGMFTLDSKYYPPIKSYVAKVNYGMGFFNIDVEQEGFKKYDDLAEYYKDLHKQFNDFTNKRFIKLDEIKVFINKGFEVYYDNDYSKRNIVKVDSKFTLEEINNYKFYVFA